jgi:hypothetical protein
MGSLAYLMQEELLHSLPGDSLLPGLAVYYGADTGFSGMQGDGPKPALRVGLDKNVVFIRGRKAFSSRKIPVDRQILEEGIPSSKAQLAAEQSGGATGIYDEASLDHSRLAIGGAIVD